MIEPFIKDFNYPIIGVSGFTRSGKAMLMNIISSLDGVEKSNTDVLFEQIYYLHKIKKINTNVATYFLRKYISILFYYNSIGRNINFKKKDFSSIYNYRNPSLYIKRANTSLEGAENIKFKNSFQIMLHSGLNSAELIFNSIPSIKVLEIIKNPMELVYSWILKNYGKEIYDGQTVYVLTLKYKNHILPYYAHGWENEYIKLNHFDRVAKMIVELFHDREKQLKKIKEKNKENMLLVYFDEFVSKPQQEIKKISNFLKKKITKDTKKSIFLENCPREIMGREYINKKLFLKKKISPNFFNELCVLEKKYLNRSILKKL
jgi:hypothetical protein